MMGRPSSSHFSQVNSMNNQRPPNTPPRPPRITHLSLPSKDTPRSHSRVSGPINNVTQSGAQLDPAQQDTNPVQAYSNNEQNKLDSDLSQRETMPLPAYSHE